MKHNRGFTMVELLIVIGIMGIFMVILSQVFVSILSMKLRSEATTAVAQDSRYLIARLSYDIARADNVSVSNPSTLILTINGVTHTYSLENNQLSLTVASGDPQVLNGLNTQILTLVFTPFPSLGSQQSVQINLTIRPTIIQPGGATGERHLITTIATR